MTDVKHKGSAIDTIVVRRSDGTLSSTCFYVSFGRKWAKRLVQLTVNRKPVAVFMKVNSEGMALWNSSVPAGTAPPSSSSARRESQLESGSYSSFEATKSNPHLLEPSNAEREAVASSAHGGEVALSLSDSLPSLDSSLSSLHLRSRDGGVARTAILEEEEGRVRQGTPPVGDSFVDPVLLSLIPPTGDTSLEPLRLYTVSPTANHVESGGEGGSRNPSRQAPPVAFSRGSSTLSGSPSGELEAPISRENSGALPSSLSPSSNASPLGALYENPIPSYAPSCEELQAMQLQYGENEVVFTVVDEQPCTAGASVFLWDDSDRLIISDVDGTITKSDLLGHAYALVGRGERWIHPGICGLYSKIEKNGYRFVYLTARSMHQARGTNSFLRSLAQNRILLPRGPLLCCPTSVFSAIKQEMVRQSHLFKIRCLKDLRASFSAEAKPFFAAFGNRTSDFVAYVEAGVPARRIYLLDSRSSVQLSSMKFHLSAAGDQGIVDGRFPPRRRPVEEWKGRETVGELLTTTEVDGSLEAVDGSAEINSTLAGGSVDGHHRLPSLALSPHSGSPTMMDSVAGAGGSSWAGSKYEEGSARDAGTQGPRSCFSPAPTPGDVAWEPETEYDDHLYWRIDPMNLIDGSDSPSATTTASNAAVAKNAVGGGAGKLTDSHPQVTLHTRSESAGSNVLPSGRQTDTPLVALRSPSTGCEPKSGRKFYFFGG